MDLLGVRTGARSNIDFVWNSKPCQIVQVLHHGTFYVEIQLRV